MTVEQVLRRIEKECREDVAAHKGYAPRWRGDKGSVMKGAKSEARGVVDKCGEIRTLCRQLRRQHRVSTMSELESKETGMTVEETNERYAKMAKSDGTLDVNWFVENKRLYRRTWNGEEWSDPVEHTNVEMAYVMTGIENRLADIIMRKTKGE